VLVVWSIRSDMHSGHSVPVSGQFSMAILQQFVTVGLP